MQSTGARFSLLFGLEDEPENYRMLVDHRDVARTGRFFQMAMEYGVFTWAGFHHGISSSHTDADVDAILERLDDVMRRLG